MWRSLFSCLFLLGLFCTCIALSGCTPEKIADTATTISTMADSITPFTPPPVSWIGYTISALASAVAAIGYGIKERRGKTAMRKGIQAIGKVVDHAKYSKKEEVRSAATIICELFSSAKTLNNPGIRDDLLLADAVRKNLR